MDLFNADERVFRALRADERLTDTIILKAFPYTDKPTRLPRTVIAVQSAALSSGAASIGGAAQYGRVQVTAAVYTPQTQGSSALCAAAENAVKAVLPLLPAEISVSSAEANDTLSCLTCRCTFTFPCHFINGTEGSNGV